RGTERSLPAIVRQHKGVERRLLNLAIWTALGLAVGAQDIQLVLKSLIAQAREQIARIPVLRHQAQGLFFATPANQNRRMWLAHRPRRVERALELIMLALERPLISRPHLVRNL